jgi:hypothetical protein
VTPYAFTREEDDELALSGLSRRAGERVPDALPGLPATLGLLFLGSAPAPVGPGAPDAAATYPVAASLLNISFANLLSPPPFQEGRRHPTSAA